MTDVRNSNTKDCPKCGTPMLWKNLERDRCPKCDPSPEDLDSLWYFEWALSEMIGHHDDLDLGEITSALSRKFKITKRN